MSVLKLILLRIRVLNLVELAKPGMPGRYLTIVLLMHKSDVRDKQVEEPVHYVATALGAIRILSGGL